MIMKKKSDLIIEQGEIMGEFSLETILGGCQSIPTECQYCNQCGSGGNNSGSGLQREHKGSSTPVAYIE